MWFSSWEICTRNYVAYVIRINNHYHSVEYPGVILCCNLRWLVITIVSMRVYFLEIWILMNMGRYRMLHHIRMSRLWATAYLTLMLSNLRHSEHNTQTSFNVQFKQQNVARILSADTINENIVDDDSCLAYRTSRKPKRQFRRRRFTVFHWL